MNCKTCTECFHKRITKTQRESGWAALAKNKFVSISPRITFRNYPLPKQWIVLFFQKHKIHHDMERSDLEKYFGHDDVDKGNYIVFIGSIVELTSHLHSDL